MNSLLKVFYILTIFLLFGCQQEKKLTVNQIKVKEEKGKVSLLTHQFKDYWYSGKAELNSYELKQSRYGEIRNGEVVLVFVTEPFSLSKQVKLDHPQKAGSDHISVMKLNNIRKFTTGIYDYSIVTSTFTPIDSKIYPHTLKSNTSIQEWCGHTFTQLNLNDKGYQIKQFSYFETDGDTEIIIPKALLEEELMTRIRLQKGQLPLGEVDMIFSTIYSRFAYQKLKTTKAKISKTASDSIIKYNIEYLNYDRKISIDVQNEFPYKILSWTEDNGNGLITEARLKKSINEPYWSQKSLTDEAKRKELELLR
ncbi:septum formation inhibitor Maf [Polaribacter sp. MSW13]|uniref:Septum formation inhibitor Maf n=1 Tax=Polaribacter marinus TaxID=2916838 RepID=A0A9X1VKE8_9FLAO|nr:septum formation inhibitor Maf [Polaribacter marinus]MCI2228129.1 septum formation inhibitor Maf [Polaribacter marinus]